MNVEINILELASELADSELRSFFQGDIDIEDNETIQYTEEAQEVFDELYDKYYSMIDNLKIN